MNASQEFVYVRTYARWLPHLGRRENWSETVDRYVSFLAEERGTLIPKKVLRKISEGMLGMHALPSMRLLWAAGSAARADNVTAYNCLSRDTKFITTAGVKSFVDFKENDKVTVLGHSSQWCAAVVRKYGKQDIYRLRFRGGSNGNDHIVKATANHRWLLPSGKVVTTEQLVDGQSILSGAPVFDGFDYERARPDERMYWAYGYVYGDGTCTKSNGVKKYSMVRLCKKDAKYKTRFEELGFSTSTNQSLEGDFIAFTGTYLKTLPNPVKDDPRLIRAFVAGYLDADGSWKHTPKGRIPISIQATSIEAQDFIRNVFPVAGVYITREEPVAGVTNFGKRKQKTVRFGLRINRTDKSNAAFKFIDAKYIGKESVWCLEVSGDKSFTLPFGMVTGNCAFAEIDSINAFSECLYILMCGTGYGFSVAAEAVNKLPVVPHLSGESVGTFVIEDSREGWAESVKALMTALYAGKQCDMNYNLLRPRGARLVTMGGRSSGPAPLIQLHQFIREVFDHAQGRRLTPLECHDICNQIAEIVVVGGVRRSSQISLSDLVDDDMRFAKEHPFPLRRAMANNSAIYTERPSAVDFLREWASLAGSGTGERGIFNLAAARASTPERRDASKIRGVNPCAEILLRAKEFCNLSEVVVRPGDDLDSLLEKVETATWIGAIQSTFTNFPYLGPTWKMNCDEERLLGVSITGQLDNPSALTADALRALKARAIKVAKHAASKLGINNPAAVTCVKPSGTVSQLVDSSSGLHPRYAHYYLRRYRVAAVDPVVALLKDQGFPLSPENGQRAEDWEKARRLHKAGKPFTQVCSIFNKGDWHPEAVMTWVATFAQHAPEGAVTRDQMSAIQQLEWYKHVQTNWCEHNASCTVYVRDEEWFEVGNWVYQNWDVLNGVSFLPYDGGRYEQAPYQEITSEEYDQMSYNTPAIDFSKLAEYEKEDAGTGSREVACSGSSCDI